MRFSKIIFPIFLFAGLSELTLADPPKKGEENPFSAEQQKRDEQVIERGNLHDSALKSIQEYLPVISKANFIAHFAKSFPVAFEPRELSDLTVLFHKAAELHINCRHMMALFDQPLPNDRLASELGALTTESDYLASHIEERVTNAIEMAGAKLPISDDIAKWEEKLEGRLAWDLGLAPVNSDREELMKMIAQAETELSRARVHLNTIANVFTQEYFRIHNNLRSNLTAIGTIFAEAWLELQSAKSRLEGLPTEEVVTKNNAQEIGRACANAKAVAGETEADLEYFELSLDQSPLLESWLNDARDARIIAPDPGQRK